MRRHGLVIYANHYCSGGLVGRFVTKNWREVCSLAAHDCISVVSLEITEYCVGFLLLLTTFCFGLSEWFLCGEIIIWQRQ